MWMDDIDTRFRDLAKQDYSTNEINRFLERIADAGVILAATTRTGPAYYDFRHRFGLDDHLWDKSDTARAIVEEMKAAGITPNLLTFSSVFAKNLSLVNADDLLDWYLNQLYHPEGPMDAAIKSYRRVVLVHCALVIALHYPHLATARKLIRENEESALTYFRSVVDLDPSHGNGNYALGIALIEVNRGLEATPYLEKALTQASIRHQSSPRVKHIEKLLRRALDGTPG